MAIRKIGSNYQVDYYVGSKRCREIVGPSKKDAEVRLGKVKVAIREGRFFDVKKETKITFDELLEKYVENFRKQKYFHTGKRFLIKSILPFFTGKKLSEITYLNLETFRNKRTNTPLKSGKPRSIATVNREITCLHHMLTKAVEWEMMEKSPFDKGKTLLMKENNKRDRYLSEEEIESLLVACDECPAYLKPIVICVLNTGMRRQEVLGLRWENVRGDFISLKKTKTNEPRQIPINNDLKAVFKGLRRRNQLKSAYVFCDQGGKPFREVKKSFSSAVKRAGIENFRFHDLRHTFASWWVMKGGSLHGLRQVLGHKDLKMTMRYAHLSREYQKEEINLLNGLTGKNNGQKESRVKSASL